MKFVHFKGFEHVSTSPGFFAFEYFFEDNALFLTRIPGNSQPLNHALGALVLDADQAQFLLHTLNTISEFDLTDKGKSLSYNTRSALERMVLFLDTVDVQPNNSNS
ncbi:hypothetical protein [Paralysiella testudinis]|uniref:Uncharacterized protein n=1 Tax=Paralysiella testudinis TaxID=2809020 RepID=A0A892ZLG2_9NEIS|nr:hypothetical protein [Paralysiella testudinis]QRQ82526.1 hypothetical protein JQU52_03765 [Paralysiella testudinis]